MNIAVYCGCNPGSKPEYVQAAEELGRWIGSNGHSLVFGAGATGIMGAVSTSTLENGGKAYGVTTGFLEEMEGTTTGLTSLEIVPTISVRRAHMMEMADAFVILPGGPGTLEELSEIMSLIRVDQLKEPMVFVNVCDFFGPLNRFLENIFNNGFIEEHGLKLMQRRIRWANTVQECVMYLEGYAEAKAQLQHV